MAQFERRKTYRIEVDDISAHCCTDSALERYIVENISHGGVLLAGGPTLPEETLLNVLLSLPGDDALSVDGVVRRSTRSTADKGRLAIEFGYLNDDEQETLDDFIVGKVVRSLSPVDFN